MALPKKTTADYEAVMQQLAIVDAGIVKSEFKIRSTVSSRRPLWSNIRAEITRLSKLEAGYTSEIYVYGDCIDSASHTPKISLTVEVCIILTARLWFPSATTPLDVSLPPGSSIEFRTNALPPGFSVVINGIMMTLEVEPGSWGVVLKIAHDEITMAASGRPKRELDALDYWAQVTPEGTLRSRINFNLGRLLQYQFILASTWMQTDTPTTYSILSFIADATQGNTAALELNLQANALAARLRAASTGFSAYVPALNLGVYKSVFKARLATVIGFENSYDCFISDVAEEENATTWAEIVLAESGVVASQHSFLETVARERNNDARKAYELAANEYKKLRSGLDGLTSALYEGIGRCARSQMGATRSGANNAEGTRKLHHAANGLNKSNEILKKIQELLEKVSNIFDVTAEIVKALGSPNMAGTIVPKDYLAETEYMADLATEWDSYAADVKMAFDPIAEDGIAGLAEYLSSTLRVIALGKSILAAQTTYITTADTLTCVVLQQRVATRHNDRLKTAITNMSTDKCIQNIVVRAMSERLFSVRALVAINFQSYITAYTFFSLSCTPQIEITATKPPSHYFDDVVTLKGAVVSARAELRSQERTFVFTQEALGANWKTDLQNSRELSFTIDVTNEIFSKFCRVRVSRARVYLRGAVNTGGPTIDLEISTMPSFRDIDLISPHKAIELVGETSQRFFEYKTDGREIVTDGMYVDIHEYSRPALFTTWNVKVLDKTVNLEGVMAVQFEFTCEVSRR